MKKTVILAMLVALGANALVSCQKEVEVLIVPGADEGKEITVTVNTSPDYETRASFTDEDGMYWTNGESLRAISAAGGADASATVGGDKYAASYSFTLNTAQTYVFRSHSHNDAGEFEYSRDFTQAEAGEMNSTYLFLHSGRTYHYTPDVENPTVNAEMKLAGAILRFIPFSSVNKNVSIAKLTLEAGNNFIGTSKYDYNTGGYGTMADAYIWAPGNTATVTLGTAFSLDGVNSRAASKGIYLPVPVTTGYTGLNSGFTVTLIDTDNNAYVFTAKKALSYDEGEVVNIPLDLTKAVEHPYGKLMLALNKVTNNVVNPAVDPSQVAGNTGGNFWVGLKNSSDYFNTVSMSTVEWSCQVYSTLRGVDTYITEFGVHGTTYDSVNNCVGRTGVDGDFDFTFNMPANTSLATRTWHIVITSDDPIVINSPYDFSFTQAAGSGKEFRVSKAENNGTDGDINHELSNTGTYIIWFNVATEGGVEWNWSITEGETERDSGSQTGPAAPAYGFPANTSGADITWTFTATTEDPDVAVKTITYEITQHSV